jgi:hypothetical protein
MSSQPHPRTQSQQQQSQHARVQTDRGQAGTLNCACCRRVLWTSRPQCTAFACVQSNDAQALRHKCPCSKPPKGSCGRNSHFQIPSGPRTYPLLPRSGSCGPELIARSASAKHGRRDRQRKQSSHGQFWQHREQDASLALETTESTIIRELPLVAQTHFSVGCVGFVRFGRRAHHAEAHGFEAQDRRDGAPPHGLFAHARWDDSRALGQLRGAPQQIHPHTDTKPSARVLQYVLECRGDTRA